jgi:hypothetical protein
MGAYILQAQQPKNARENYYIVVEYDDYRIPVRCAQYTRDIDLDIHPTSRVDYSPAQGVKMTHYGSSLSVAKVDQSHVFSEESAFEALGLTAEACARIQERRFDPDYDEYVGPGDDYGHARPEHDATPRTPSDSGDDGLIPPPNDSTVDDPGADTEDRD